MKGTPFYSGEYAVRQGPVEDRVNLWPLLYYRDPALSVLWPIMEVTDDHFALRPLLSIYDRNETQRVVNVLWPVAQFDGQSGNNRIFPVFWGNDYRVVFPLYWHHGQPFGDDGGYDGLLPLWSYRKDTQGFSTHILWPLFHVERRGDEHGWRAWPLAGRYASDASAYRFLLWPLGHQWSRANGERGHMFLPLYAKQHDAKGDLFVSLPYSSRRRDDGSGWQLVLPLGYRSFDTDRSLVISPLYAGAHDQRAEERWSLLVPLFFRSQNANEALFISLPWMAGRRGAQRAWQFAPPLFFRRHTESGTVLATPVFARGTRSEDERRWHAVLPLYYRRVSRDGKVLATLAGGVRTDAQGKHWLLYPLLSGGKTGPDGGEVWVVAPLFHAEWDARGSSHHLLPLYYWDGRSRTFVSPLAARWRNDDDKHTTIVPPLLSLLREGEHRSDLWFLAGMGKASWGDEPGARYLAPLFYSHPDSETFLSLPWARWSAGGVDYRTLPLLLSGYATDGQTTDVLALLGLFYNRSAANPVDRRGHLVPLYYYEGGRKFLTPLFGWDKDPANGFVYPFTPLAAWRTGNYSGGWIFPLFSRKRSRTEDRCDGTFLWGRYWSKGDTGGSGMFPLYTYRNDGPLDAASTNETARYATYGKQAFFLPACWYRNQIRVHPGPRPRSTAAAPGAPRTRKPVVRTRIRENGFFPLWTYSRKERLNGPDVNTSASILLLLYDYKRTVTPDPDGAVAATNDYTRARILWRLWHYERSNGDVSVDVFPAITYDRKKDGFKKLSFLWRFFRYERGKDGMQLDLLFVPVRRGRDTSSSCTHQEVGAPEPTGTALERRPPVLPAVHPGALPLPN